MSVPFSRRAWLRTSGMAAAGAWAGNTMAAAGAPAPATGATVTFQRSLPVRHDVDVFVAGGGPAGAAAAVTARKQGAKVFLAEAHTCFGGMGTAGRVPTFMQVSDGVNYLAAGFGQELIKRMRQDSNMRKNQHIDNEALKRAYDAMVTEADVNFTFYTTMTAVEAEQGHVKYVACASPSGMFAVRAKVYIDCTGNGDLATWAGAKFEKGDGEGNLMPGTLCSVWSEIDWDTWNANKPKGPQPDGHMLEKAFADGVFTVRDEHLTGMHRTGEHLGGGNIGHAFGVDADDEVSLSKALVTARKSLKEFERYYREYLKGFEKIQLVASGSLLGVRETRRILGDYVLSLDDYKRRAIFPDEIGRYAYPIDNHPVRPGKDTYEQHRKEFDQEMRYGKGESYGIPYRALTPKGLDNVLVAGRCVSADRMVHGSIRVMPGCFITGQAAGAAGALAAATGKGPRAIDVRDLQRRLKALGAFLPNA